jgi:hypothetical protein
MRMWFRVAMCAALLGLAALPSPVVAQQKTVKACQDEWRANKADNQAKGITEKAYVAQCRTGGLSARPTSAPAAAPAPTPSAAAPTPTKTVKACQDEWRANKAAYQAAKDGQDASNVGGISRPRFETKRRDAQERCCFSSLAVCADHARDRRETPYALALCRVPLRSGAIARYRVHPDMA